MAKDQAQVSESAFIARLKKKEATLKKAAKVQAQTYLQDSDVIELFGLDSDTRHVVTATLTSVRFGVSKKGDEYFSFSFVVSEGEHKGVNLPSVYCQIDTTDSEKEEKSFGRIMGNFQRLGYDTAEWGPGDLVEAAKEASKDKPVVKLSLSCWQKDANSDPRLNMNVISLVNQAATEEAEDEEEEVEDEGANEEATEESSEEETEEEAEEGDEEVTGDDMVGYTVDFKLKGKPNTMKGGEILSYDADKNVFEVEHKGKVYKGVPFDNVTIPE